jgi:hypothetical protein
VRAHGEQVRASADQLVFGIASAVQADIPDSGVIHGCYGKPGTPFKGNLRVRDASQGEQCAPNSTDHNCEQDTSAPAEALESIHVASLPPPISWLSDR